MESNRTSQGCRCGKTMLQGLVNVEQGHVGDDDIGYWTGRVEGSSQSSREDRRERSDLHLYWELAESPLDSSSTSWVELSPGILGNWHSKRGQRLSKRRSK